MHKFLTTASLIFISQVSFAAVWELNNSKSFIHFESTKNETITEESKFEHLSGNIDDQTARAKVEVSLNSVDTNIPLRDERITDLLFEIARYPLATLTTQFTKEDMALVNDMQAHTVATKGSLDFHGVKHEIETEVIVQKLDANTLQVKSAEPIVLDTDDYNLQTGMDALQKIVGLRSIDTSVPVSFTLVFEKE